MNLVPVDYKTTRLIGQAASTRSFTNPPPSPPRPRPPPLLCFFVGVVGAFFCFQCLINENEKVRRDLCGCAELNPALASVSENVTRASIERGGEV